MDDGTAQIGVVGLGTMGANLALNIAEKGFVVAGYNRTPERAHELAGEAASFGGTLVAADTPEAFVTALKAPRIVLLMVPAGPVVDDQIEMFRPLLTEGDIIIDAGNADFNDTVRRTGALEGSGIHFVGIGVSGGEQGARHGPSIMAGGPAEIYPRIQPILEGIAARYRGEPCVAHLGPDGAGHFVKTLHNGIEYADMQMIAEVYGILRDGLGLSTQRMAEIFEGWNAGGLQSYLVEITAVVLRERDGETGEALVDVIVDEAGQKGTGRWAVIEAQKLGAGATTLEAAVSARGVSSRRAERAAASKTFAGLMDEPSTFEDGEIGIAELERALETAKLIAYAQGFAAMASASAEFGWNLPLGTVARIWRAGCIIRSRFLDDIAKVYDAGDTANLLVAPDFVGRVSDGVGALRRVISKAALAGIPVPALGAALAYFDDYRRARGTTNLTQGQRDLFGAHTFGRLDRDGVFHHQWPAVRDH